MRRARGLGERRFGVMYSVSIATVPAWAPIGREADSYWAHLHPTDGREPQRPLVEVVQHHRDRWAHVEQYDEFLPFLRFDAFDPDEWASLAHDAGMGFAVMSAKHHDGLCWWDAPATVRTVLETGPSRNVFGELADACRRAGLAFGASYSPLDVNDQGFPDEGRAGHRLRSHVLDLVERYAIDSLWGDGPWGDDRARWRGGELRDAARRVNPALVVDDCWGADDHDVLVVEHRIPDAVVAEPWVFRRPLGTSGTHNRVEPDDLLLGARDIVALLTEVVAKGGGLVLRVGPDAAGSIPPATVERLRAVGGWVRRHLELVDRGRPWTGADGPTWGDADAHLIDVDGALHVVDINGNGSFRALDPSTGRVESVRTVDGTDVDFDQTDDGVRLRRPPRRGQRMPAVYRIGLVAHVAEPITLFTTAPRGPTALAPLLATARSGDIVKLGDGDYEGPARVPDGVTLRGLGPTRTAIVVAPGERGPTLTLGDDSRVEHCRVRGGADRQGDPAVFVAGDRGVVLGCTIDGHVGVVANGGRVVSCTAAGLVGDGADSLGVLRSTFVGNGDDTGIAVIGGAALVVDGCELTGHRAAIELVRTVGAAVRHNRMRARWWGVRLTDTEATTVTGNAIERTSRAVDIDGGSDARINGNAASDGDSGCVLQGGASNVEVTGNYWERCRVGLLAWGAGEYHQRDNTSADLVAGGAAHSQGP